MGDVLCFWLLFLLTRFIYIRVKVGRGVWFCGVGDGLFQTEWGCIVTIWAGVTGFFGFSWFISPCYVIFD